MSLISVCTEMNQGISCEHLSGCSKQRSEGQLQKPLQIFQEKKKKKDYAFKKGMIMMFTRYTKDIKKDSSYVSCKCVKDVDITDFSIARGGNAPGDVQLISMLCSEKKRTSYPIVLNNTQEEISMEKTLLK